MKISQIRNCTNNSQSVFKGYIVKDNTYYNEPTTHSKAAYATGRPVERTLGSFHLDRTGKIYYADPLEKISDGIREQVDYVVYDNEPRVPDINREVSKLYFEPSSGAEEAKYLKQLNDAREYFYRLEMADSKTVGHYEKQVWSNVDKENSRAKADYFKAHVNDAKYNQETLAVSENILNESSDLRYQKDSLHSEIQNIKETMKQKNEKLSADIEELHRRKETDLNLKAKIQYLSERESLYKKLQSNINKSEFAKENEVYVNEKKHIDTGVKSVQRQLELCRKNLAENTTLLNKVADSVKNLPNVIKDLSNKLVDKNKAFEKAKADLIPYFDKLKNYFYSRGLKTIK